MLVRGRAWKLGDNVSTDHIISGKYKFKAIHSLEEMLPYLLAEVRPGFYREVRPGDVIVAGRNFGCGSSREHAPRLIKLAGVGAVIARSFARIFYRNSINIGLPVVEVRELPGITADGDLIEVDLEGGVVRNLTKGFEEAFRGYPREILEIVREGGIIEYVRRHGDLPWGGGTG